MLSEIAKKIDEAFSLNTVTVYWKGRFGKGRERYYPDTIADDKILRGLECLRGCGTSFSFEQADFVIAELGRFGFGLTTIGVPDYLTDEALDGCQQS